MSGPTPITATNRVTFNYNTGFGARKLHVLCDIIEGVGGAPTFSSFVGQHGSANFECSLGIDLIWSRMAAFYDPAHTQFGSAVLEARVGTEYVPFFSYLTAITPSSSGQIQLQRMTIPGADDENFRVSPVIFEGNVPVNEKFVAYAIMSAAMKNWVTAWYGVGATPDPHDPYFWAVSRANRPLFRWKSLLTKTDDKLRRKAGDA